MENYQAYLQLLYPLMMFIFSVGFYVLHFNYRSISEAFWLAIGFFLIGLYFQLHFIQLFADAPLPHFLVTSSLIAGSATVVYGITDFFEHKFPKTFIAAVIVIQVFLETSYYFVSIEPLAKIILLNFLCGAIFIAAAVSMRNSKEKFGNKIVFIALAVAGVKVFAHIPVMMALFEEPLTLTMYENSYIAVIILFAVTFFSLTIGMTLLLALGMQLVTNVHAQSLIDPLSNIYNRRGLTMKVEPLMEGHKRDSMPLSIVVCDIDHFKAVNDTFGHTIGDDVIVKLAKLLTNSSRKSDLCARIGGEEFCIVLWNTNLQGAKLFANAVRMKVQEIEFEGMDPNKPISASFGVAEMLEGDDYNELFERADSALYQAKQSGRDKVCGPLSVELSALYSG